MISHGLMDYSLLLVIVKNDKKLEKELYKKNRYGFNLLTTDGKFIISVGIIDYLQVFDIQKSL